MDIQLFLHRIHLLPGAKSRDLDESIAETGRDDAEDTGPNRRILVSGMEVDQTVGDVPDIVSAVCVRERPVDSRVLQEGPFWADGDAETSLLRRKTDRESHSGTMQAVAPGWRRVTAETWTVLGFPAALPCSCSSFGVVE